MKTIDYQSCETEMLGLLDRAYNEDNSVGTTIYFSSAAIVQGLYGVLQALHAINENLLQMRREDASNPQQ